MVNADTAEAIIAKLLKPLRFDPDTEAALLDRTKLDVERLVAVLPEPDAWAVPKAPTGGNATLFVLAGGCFVTVLVARQDDQACHLTTTSRGLDPARDLVYLTFEPRTEERDSDGVKHAGTPTTWTFTAAGAPDIKINGFICDEHGPDSREQLARAIAAVLGWRSA
jgi:hypothetical protein